jgi:hypothetical protein
MASDDKETKNVIVPRTAADIQRFKLQKLLKNPDKPAYIPEKPEEKLPRVFKPPEFVRNIWGSSAGAGSGDFHVYRGVRRREYARQKFLTEKSEKDKLDDEFQKRLKEHKKADQDKSAKKRAKRMKKKMKQKAKKTKLNNNSANGKGEESEDSEEESADESPEKKPRLTSTKNLVQEDAHSQQSLSTGEQNSEDSDASYDGKSEEQRQSASVDDRIEKDENSNSFSDSHSSSSH